MTMLTHAERATRFRALHQGRHPLLLANAWDLGSALLIQSLGAPAIATTSAGVAWTQGQGDGGQLSPNAQLSLTASMAARLQVPLSVDIENGYSDDPAAVASFVVELARSGAVGINIEDGTDAPDLLVAKITAIRSGLSVAGLDLFINARTDVYLRALVPAAERVAATLARAQLYAAAGADGLFVPGLSDSGDISTITEGTPLPLNLLAVPGLAAADALHALGVRRLSTGSALPQRLWRVVEELAGGFLAAGASDAVCADTKAYADLNRIMG